jgi:hypothetical protein
MKIRFTLAAAAIALATLGVGTANAANLLSNGSFEDTTNFVNQGNDTMVVNVGDNTTLPGWTVISNQLAWLGPTNSFALTASDGSYFLDLQSYNDAGTFGGVSQSISTVLGQSYTLSYELGSSTQWGVPDGITACAGATCATSSFAATGLNQWAGETLSFTGTGNPMVISLTGVSGFAYIGLDDVSVVTSGVPEPATWAMFLVGFGAIGWTLRNARSKGAAVTA